MLFRASSAAAALALSTLSPALADEFILDDLAVDGNACIGFSCVNNEIFGVDVLRLKDNTIRVNFQDTSAAAGFATNDWRITVNGELSGGQDFFSVDDVSAQTVPFLIEAAAPTNALYVSGEGPIGFGTNLPQMELHIRDGDTPTVRLEQDGTQQNTPRIWDLGGNDANFFIRDATSNLQPFRIRPGAPENALYVAANGEVGMGIPDPRGALHIRRNQPNNVPHVILQNRRQNGRAEIWFEDDQTPTDNDALRLQLNGDVFNLSFNGTGGAELSIAKTGDVTVPRGDVLVPNGSVRVGGQSLNVPDYVFAPDYDLMPLRELEAFVSRYSHLPHIPSATDIHDGELDLVTMQLALLKTVEELVLHTFALQAEIDALKENGSQRVNSATD